MKKIYCFLVFIFLLHFVILSCQGEATAVYVFEPKQNISENEGENINNNDSEAETVEAVKEMELEAENTEAEDTLDVIEVVEEAEDTLEVVEVVEEAEEVDDANLAEGSDDENSFEEENISEDCEEKLLLPEGDEVFIEESVNSEDISKDNKADEEDGISDAEYGQILSPIVKEREWSILIYMGADNNLEASAIEDLNEMEHSLLDTDVTNVLVLLDRSEIYDTSNGNWSGAKLFKLKTGKSENITSIISEEIDCPALAIKKGASVALDMSSSYVLEECISFMKEAYTANHYGLVVWGHGTGWRNDSSDSQLFKGFAYDDSSKTYMTLKQLGNALSRAFDSHKVDFLGFDTCFASELELLYELKNSARYIAGSEGLLLYSGWNYRKLFDYFQSMNKKSADELCYCVVKQFSEQFNNTQRASIAAVDTGYISALFTCFDAFMAMSGSKISNRTIRDNVMGILYSNSNCDTERYCYGTEGSDIYIDLISAASNLSLYFESIGISLSSYYNNLKNVLANAVLYSWASDRSDMRGSFSANKAGIGVYFSTLGSNGMLLTVHPSAYIKNKTSEQISFVAESNGYVPAVSTKNSLLDKLFYTSF